ncbi:hypothetical protein [Janthinobacterium aquaticum]|uniref:hypothetical protein n=1 Tax=Janthinobacterium sp. FT58W TaxID=2654254 RepID=UPI00186B2A54|nr:hypothetical protein [Janthinobacterium sp. FT58W]
MTQKFEQAVIDGTLADELERERVDHMLVDEEKLGMDELEETRLKGHGLPDGPRERRH